ncbi:hypothetical protein A2Z67_00045 [Candidatus Woesebacteria bacterium RBG_13_36_22]|uniref:NodB homology domain-containing protein n=1 Tax=Candidatus Woesebacteria bacterium RBG_13_36_22 TaxID=1802478 RepID=A0A1F7X6M2_9BACT|nr:MAG: hypothetical protein A2Z67_00045 [Candidatus Woesebacteria bacterium RBG_13_36_22]
MKTFIGVCLCLVLLFLPGIGQANKVPVLMYHHIRDSGWTASIGKDLSCSPNIFVKHLDFLEKNGYKTVTFRDAYLGNLPKKAVILTFDDGDADQWFAFTEMKKRGMVGCFFIVTNFIDGGGFFSSSQIRQLSNNGMEIGSHSISHPNLTKLSRKRMSEEINGSQLILGQLTGKRAITFAYPYGSYNRQVLEEMDKSDYLYARTTNEGISNLEDNFCLKITYIHRGMVDLGRYLK